MNFDLSEEQQTIAELAREILVAEATHERVKEIEKSEAWFDLELWMKLAEANLLGIAIPESFAGMGFGFAEMCPLLEELGRQLPPVPALATLVLGSLPLVEFGTEAQQSEWLPRIASGEAIASAALIDADSGNASTPATRARADGGSFVLDGSKRGVPWGDRADVILVPASTDDGVRVFLLDPHSDGVEVTCDSISTGEPMCDLHLRGVRVAAESVLGTDADGAGFIEWLEERALIAICAMQVGASARALEITSDYAREREQFNVPIGSFQAVQHRAADAFIDLEAMRWTMWHAAWRISQGLPARREAWVAKFWSAEAGSRIANSSLHLHAGLGSDVDYPIQRYFLWSKALELNLGGATRQLARLGRDMARTGPQEQV